MSKRVPVITGIGVVAPGAIGREAYWDLLTQGRTATRKISLFDAEKFRSRIAAEVDFDPVGAGLTHQQVRRMDRAAQFAVVCTREAVADSGLDIAARDPERVAVSLGSAVGCTTGLEEEYRVISDSG
ncbi:MAG TPA: beta-ketoacyl synthase N-terminal-like domain-containing protein, partial [Pseudonocardiaceae bacterium]